MQYVVDGIPLTENRSPTYSPGMNADDVQSLAVLTSNFPAEYGRKLGGIIEVATKSAAAPGIHGQVIASGGTFASAGGYAEVVDARRQQCTRWPVVEQDATDRYLDPPVLNNFNNHGVNGNQHFEFQRSFAFRRTPPPFPSPTSTPASKFRTNFYNKTRGSNRAAVVPRIWAQRLTST